MTLAERVSAFLSPPRKASVEIIEQKAGVGPGAYVMEYHEPLARHQRDPQKFMKYAQSVSRKNPWVNTAEGIISGKGSTIDWHLEDEDAETVDDENGGGAAFQAVRSIIERPNPQMTRSKLWSITLRHMGVCGNAFWYLDRRDGLAGTPLAIYYINPARMRPATDKQGNLTGWVLDAEDTYEYELGNQTGVPLDTDEVIHFTLEPPDWGYLGHGLIEAAENLLALNSAAERYLTQVMATGGRRGHLITPKDGRMDDDVFQSLVAGLRNVAESPDAAKRNIVAKGPLEMQPQAVTPNEVGAMGVLTEMREDIVSGVWRVPLSQLGVPLPAGLNSGDSRKWEEAALWQNAIEPRLTQFAETIQFHLLDRWKEVGVALDLVLETPQFDDATPAWDLLSKSESAPVTWNEQRALVGLDPLPDYLPSGEPLGVRITMPDKIIQVAFGPDEAGSFQQPPVPTPTLLEPGKASLDTLRSKIERTAEPKIRAAIAKFLTTQRDEIAERLRAKAGHLLGKPTDTSWWSAKFWDDELRAALVPVLAPLVSQVGGEIEATLGKPKKADGDFLARVLAFVERRTGERITGINATTQADVLRAVKDAIAEATEAGYGAAKTADLIRDRVAGLTTWNDARAELISRTELMNAYNDAALTSYKEFDVARVQALDGDKDDECAARNGREYPIDEAYSIADHPNGTLDWIPVKAGREEDVTPDEVRAIVAQMLGTKASTDAVAMAPLGGGSVIQILPSPLLPTITNEISVPPSVVNIPEARPPVVNVTVPKQDAPVVNVAVPEQKALLPQDINIVSMPSRVTRKAIERDPTTGRPTTILEESLDG